MFLGPRDFKGINNWFHLIIGEFNWFQYKKLSALSLELDVGLCDGLPLQRQQIPGLHRHDANYAVPTSLCMSQCLGAAKEVK